MVKKIPWGHKDPAVIVGGVIGSRARMGGGSGPCLTHFGCVSTVKNMLLVKKINLCGKKTIPWGCKDPVVIVRGVIGNSACTGSGSGPCRTHFGCVSTVKKCY